MAVSSLRAHNARIFEVYRCSTCAGASRPHADAVRPWGPLRRGVVAGGLAGCAHCGTHSGERHLAFWTAGVFLLLASSFLCGLLGNTVGGPMGQWLTGVTGALAFFGIALERWDTYRAGQRFTLVPAQALPADTHEPRFALGTYAGPMVEAPPVFPEAPRAKPVSPRTSRLGAEPVILK